MQSERESINRLCNPKFKVSSHYLIGKSGKIIMLVKEIYPAWHAGKSCWKNYKNLNKNSIGIELVNKGHQFGYKKFNNKQIKSLIKLCKKLTKKYKIKNTNILGHSDIAPLRKIDPGENFHWKKLARNKLGIWHDCDEKILKKNRMVKISTRDQFVFTNNLKKIGYCVLHKKMLFYNSLIKNFQRHFRPELVNGRLDKECSIIASNLVKNL